MARILNVISAVTPGGGTVTKLRVLMQNSAEHSHFVYFPGFKSNKNNIINQLDWYSQHGIPAYYGIFGRNICANALKVSKIIRENKIDIVHFYFNHEQTFAGLVKLLNPRVQLIRSIVGYDGRLSRFRRLIVRSSITFIDNYIFISKYIKNLYEKEYPLLKKKNTCIVYNGFVNVKDQIAPIEGRKILVSTGGLCERKNHKILIEAMNILVNQYAKKDLVLKLVGDDALRKEYDDLIEKYSLKNNVFIEGLRNNVGDYLNECAIYLHPATTEGFGIAVVEAMYMKCPCIVANKGALPELVEEGTNGFIVDAYSAKEWADRVIDLINDDVLRKEFSENSHKRAIELFHISKFIEKHNQIYRNLSLHKNLL